jgi:hypothetical protein
MTFGQSLQLMLQRTGYSLVSEFVTADRRPAVRLRSIRSFEVVAMYHSDAIELARGGATIAAIVYRNRRVFGSAVSAEGEPATTGLRGTRDERARFARSVATDAGLLNRREIVTQGGPHT